MSRPEFPNCIMPANVIQRVRQEQDFYDEDPERYERHQQRQQEEREQEEQAERHWQEEEQDTL